MPIQPLTKKSKLKPGRFYRARDGSTWCCYRVDLDQKEHSQALCVGVKTSTVLYFFLDGRHESTGKGPWTLVEELVEELELGPVPSDADILNLCSSFVHLLVDRQDNGGPMLEAATVEAARKLRDAITNKLGGM